MAIYPFNNEFGTAQRNVNLGDRTKIAIAAHFEVRAVLNANAALVDAGLADVLVGSYARSLSIWPGKDVDVFGRLGAHRVETITPASAYEMFATALALFEAQGRLTRQPRSLKVSFGREHPVPERSVRSAGEAQGWSTVEIRDLVAKAASLDFEFSVDVVPGVGWEPHYGIPEVDVAGDGTRSLAQTWKQTDPVALNDETIERNREPTVSGQGAFVPTVKALKQIKSHHLAAVKPSFLFYEFMLHEGFADGGIEGETWADITSSALSYVASRLGTAPVYPVCDPILREPYAPAPDPAALETSRILFTDLAAKATFAVSTHDRCQAAITWRQILGTNRGDRDVFPLPDGCRGSGVAQGAVAANTSSGGTEERSFGRR